MIFFLINKALEVYFTHFSSTKVTKKITGIPKTQIKDIIGHSVGNLERKKTNPDLKTEEKLQMKLFI